MIDRSRLHTYSKPSKISLYIGENKASWLFYLKKYVEKSFRGP